MTAVVMISGRLHVAPIVRQTRSGGEFVAAKVKVANGNAFDYWDVVAFANEPRAELRPLEAGDAISAIGLASFDNYEHKGELRLARRLTADKILALGLGSAARRARRAPRDGEAESHPRRRDCGSDLAVKESAE